jgi:glycerol kinase
MAMAKDTCIPLKALKVDGGAADNNFLLQFQADLSGIPVEPSEICEVTALGAAYLAGLAAGYWKNKEELKCLSKGRLVFDSNITGFKRQQYLNGWKAAVSQATYRTV